MTKYRNKLILLVFFIQLLMPLSCILLFSAVLARGQEITIRMNAYDPYDMLRGRYLQLKNPNSVLVPEPNLVLKPDVLKERSDIYAVLEPIEDTGISFFSYATLERPPHGTAYIRCSASSYTEWKHTDQTIVRIHPKIDKYYLNVTDADYLERTIEADTDIQIKLRLLGGMYAVDEIEVNGIRY